MQLFSSISFLALSFFCVPLFADAATLTATHYGVRNYDFTVEFDDDNQNGLLDIEEIDDFSGITYANQLRDNLVYIPDIPGLVKGGFTSEYSGSTSAQFWYVLTGSTQLAFPETHYSYKVDGLTPVPVPPAALLFGTVLLGAGYWRRRNQKAKAA